MEPLPPQQRISLFTHAIQQLKGARVAVVQRQPSDLSSLYAGEAPTILTFADHPAAMEWLARG
jgi:hypothetical protein